MLSQEVEDRIVRMLCDWQANVASRFEANPLSPDDFCARYHAVMVKHVGQLEADTHLQIIRESEMADNHIDLLKLTGAHSLLQQATWIVKAIEALIKRGKK